ncbi:MAG: YdcF family protein [Gemmatimonadaceae bacterium]
MGAIRGVCLWCMSAAFGHPIGIVGRASSLVALAMLGTLSQLRRAPRVALDVSLAVLAIGILFFALTPTMRFVAHRWVRADPFTSPPQAVVVLSSGVNADTNITDDAADRLLSGLELAQARRLPLITTRIENRTSEGTTTSDADQHRLVALVGDTIGWQHTPPVGSTHDEAVEVARLVHAHGITTIALVTSPMHTRRACAVFEKAGLRVTCVPARTRGMAAIAMNRATDRLRAFGLWLYELAATLKYKLRGWL